MPIPVETWRCAVCTKGGTDTTIPANCTTCGAELRTLKLGMLVATPAALAMLDSYHVSPDTLLAKHQRGVWGTLSYADMEQNDKALLGADDRVLSCYTPAYSDSVWIITEHDRSVTTILLPSDY